MWLQTLWGAPMKNRRLVAGSIGIATILITASVPGGGAQAGSLSVSGDVRYYSNQAPVPGVTVTLRGVGEQTAETDGAGAFLFTGLHNRDWEIEPTKLGDVFGAVGLADAIRVLQHIVGHDSLDTFEVLACDVTGDGQVTAFDAARLFQFLLGRISGLSVATTCESDWIFVPVPIAVPNQRLLLPQAGACLHGAIAYEPLQSFASA